MSSVLKSLKSKAMQYSSTNLEILLRQMRSTGRSKKCFIHSIDIFRPTNTGDFVSAKPVWAFNLSLKVVTHFGEFTGYSVKNFQKLIGKDVIVAHQLLKNNIEQHEYWLATPNLVGDKPPNL